MFLWNRPLILAAAAATAASVTTNACEGINDRDLLEVFGSLAAEPFGGRPERDAIYSLKIPREHDELGDVRNC